MIREQVLRPFGQPESRDVRPEFPARTKEGVGRN